MNHQIYTRHKKQYCLSKVFQRRENFNHSKNDFKNDSRKKKIEHINWWQWLNIKFTIDNLLIKKAKKYQRYVKDEIKKANENIEAITKDVDDEFLFLYIFLWISF